MAPDTRTLSDSPSTGQSSYKQWAIGLLLAHQNRILSNLSRFYQQLARLPRRIRRAFDRRAALTATAAALILVISQSPVRADTITVRNGEVLVRDNGRCSLIEAILNAEDTADGVAHDDCAAGDPSGPDTIVLPDGGRFVLTRPFSDDDGLPPLTGDIFIQGNNSVIERSNRAGTPAFRLAKVSSGADIVLDGVTLRGGWVYHYESGEYDGAYGGGVFVENRSRLTISNSVIENNHAGEDGAGIYIELSGGLPSTVVIEGSAIQNNGANTGEFQNTQAGGISNRGGIVTIRNSTVSGNKSHDFYGGILNGPNPFPPDFIDPPSIRIYNSSIFNNETRDNGGGIANFGEITIVNSTISNNSAYWGGGIDNSGILTVINTTISGNTAEVEGGGVLNKGLDPELTIERSLISGNSAASGPDVYSSAASPAVLADNYNLFGHSGNAGVVNLAIGVTDIVPSVPLAQVLSPILRNNGGPTPTHALLSSSPAINRSPAADCTASPVANVDQRGRPRNQAVVIGFPASCDIGAYEWQPPVLDFTIWELLPGFPFPITPEPVCPECLVVRWSVEDWSVSFDGSKAGLTKNHAITAFAQTDPSTPDIYLTFAANTNEIPGLGNVPGQDIIFFNGQTFLSYFDGSKVGLTTSGEQIDGLHILPGAASPIGEQCQAYLLISTTGAGKVNGANGKPIKFSGEDVLGFCATGLGGQTSGKWHLVLDGSKEKVKKNAIINLSANPDGSLLYVTTAGAFDVDNAQGKENEVYRYDMTTGEFDGPLFVPAQFGLSDHLSGINVTGDLP